jgi:hypothetical protein
VSLPDPGRPSKARPAVGAATSRDPSAFVVEFLGLPGAGKSTIASAAVQQLSGVVGDVSQPMLSLSAGPSPGLRRMKKAVLSISALGRPREAWVASRVISASRQESALDAVRLLLNWFVVTSVMHRHGHRGGLCILDQGVFQAIWSVCLMARNGSVSDIATELLGSAPRPDAVVVIHSDPDIIRDRLKSRRGAASRLEQRWERADDLFPKAIDVFQGLLGIAREVCGAPQVLSVSNGSGAMPDETAASVAEYLRGLCRDHASSGRTRSGGPGAQQSPS